MSVDVQLSKLEPSNNAFLIPKGIDIIYAKRVVHKPNDIETIFSLDGLGRLGFEAAVSRDYPVVFGTLYIFGLLGLVVGLLSDLMYVWVDPRIDFEKRQS